MSYPRNLLTFVLLLCGCDTPQLSPEYLYYRVVRAEYDVTEHYEICTGSPAQRVDWDCALSLPETHDPAIRCHVQAAEDYRKCVTCCQCLPVPDACLRAYEAGKRDCGVEAEVESVISECLLP